MPHSEAARYFMPTYILEAGSSPISTSTKPGVTPARGTRAATSLRTSAAIALPSMMRAAIRDSAVPEVPRTGDDHRDAVLVGCGDDFVVAHRAARLDHRDGASNRTGIEPVAEGEERVRCHHGALGPVA